MSGSYRFYMFLTNYSGGFQAFKNKVDENKNNTIEFNELYRFINSNNDLKDITKKDIYEIWSGIDTFSIGENADSTDGVSEAGSLNSDEQKNLEKKILLYGEMDERVKRLIEQCITSSNAFDTYGLSESTIIAETIEAVLKTYQNYSAEKIISMLKSGELDKDIEKQAKNVAINEIKDKLIDNVINDKDLPEGYNIHNDEDLMGLMTSYINTALEDEYTILDNIVSDLEKIVEGYLETAEIEGADPWVVDDDYKWQIDDPMNTLQLAVLTDKYKTALTEGDYESYGGLEAVLPQITEYLAALGEEWKTCWSEEFDELYDVTAEAIVEAFKNSGLIEEPESDIPENWADDVLGDDVANFSDSITTLSGGEPTGQNWDYAGLGIPSDPGIFDIDSMDVDKNTIYYKIVSAGNTLYSRAKEYYGADVAFAAYRTFINYYRQAILQLYDNVVNKGNTGEYTYNFEYTTYKEDGTTEQTAGNGSAYLSMDGTSSIGTRPEGSATTGLSVRQNNWGYILFVDPKVMAQKFKEFLTAAKIA